MKRGFWFLQAGLILVIGLALCSGCGSSPPPVTTPPATPPTTSENPVVPVSPVAPTPPILTPAPPPTIPELPVQPVAPGAFVPPPATDPAQPAPFVEGTPPAAPEPPATPTEVSKADVGSGIQGRSLDKFEGAIVTPAKTLFTVREKVVFQVQIPHALQLYKALEGAAPKTHEEFMQRIIMENKIKLPMLPPGHTYEWDPEMEELMVRRPAK